MNSFRKALAPGSLIAALAVWMLALPGAVAAQKPGETEAKAPPIQTRPHAEYAGAETCMTCHTEHSSAITQGPHSRAFRAGSPVAQQGCQACHADTKAALGCESCHGPGKAHSESDGDKKLIRTFSKLSPNEASETCVSCHFRSQHTFWAGSQHDQRNVGCTSCHSVHAPKGEPLMQAANEQQLCSSCHSQVVRKQQRFAHMPVREDKMTCSNCHNVHGSQNVRLLRTGGSITESCTSCHAEKRGPVLWEHFPVTENCATCHDPHGSNNDRMLVSKEPFLCQRCHVTSRHPPTVYEGFLLNNSTNANKVFGRQCAACHQQVHGSNAPSGKAFLR